MADQEKPGEDLAILFPDVDMPVADPDTGRDVLLTVREPRFGESLAMAAAMRPLIADLAAIETDEVAALPDPTAIDEIIGRHADLWLELMARATGREAAWLARLGDGDGHALSLALWETHGPLLVRRVVGARAARRSLSGGSSTSSSGPDTPAGTASSQTG